ncbi:Endonuclease/exonuclease/phosphatase [Panaeolus papilionaceus]|nr:Endonuclease/exonuclease/phosphatase [Panaeolus papilionaceus]
MTHHWQQQLMKCEMSRQARSPFHRARASAMAARTVRSAIPITNPNLVRPPPEENGNSSKSPDSSPNAPNSALNHPSSTVGPIQEQENSSDSKPPASTWNSLDMGGLRLKNLPSTSGLFSFTFLTQLYLNHNDLGNVPPEISKLRHLELLDLSANNLSSLPAEVGLLTQLKEFYIFDNNLVTLPNELGNMHQLQTLGVEGNPLSQQLKSMVQKEGTAALVRYLRDTAGPGITPPPRPWKTLMKPAELEALEQDPYAETFKVLCFNILCEKYATEKLYGYTPSWALAWLYRRDKILEEIKSYDAEFLCLQEVDKTQYETFFLTSLAPEGYDGVFHPKSRFKTMSGPEKMQVDGCAIFYKKDRYKLVEFNEIEFSSVAMQRQDFKKTDDMFNRVLQKDNIAIVCLLEDVNTGTRLIVANVHITWDHAYRDVKLVQVALLVDEIEKQADHFARYPPPPTLRNGNSESKDGSDGTNGDSSTPPRPIPTYSDGTKIPLIICGDFNSVPNSGVYEFLSTGSLPSDHGDFMSHIYGRYTSEGIRHRLGLKSAYADLQAAATNPNAPAGELLSMTNYTPGFQGVLDYVWYSNATLGVKAVLGDVDKGYLEKVVGFPNPHYPSDHVSIVSEFRIKPPRPALPKTTSSSSSS